MKFPSIQRLAEGSLIVLKRFPLEVLSAIIGTVSAMVLIDRDFQDENNLLRILACSNLGLVLFLSVSVASEAGNHSLKTKTILQLLTAGLLVLIYLLLNPITEEVNGYRFAFLTTAFHLLVAFAPFIRRGTMEGFWEYNKQLFIRILTAGLYSSVLYAGLAIAIVSTDALFDFDVNEDIYGHLLCVVFGIFNTTFFMAGVPLSWKELEENQQYPKGLKIFTQYVLIPLATVYLCILLAYEGKLIIEWSLPKGLVSSLVLGYAVYGILSILLVHPIRFDEGNRWIRTFSRLFYMLLIPLIVLLVIAVWLRVDQYGITENRYVLIVLSLWLAGITIYFLSSRLQNIKVIPASLCLVALLSTWGPQSASAISQRSQIKRLVAFFESNNSLKNGKFIPVAATIDSREAADILQFLINHYGTESIQEFITVDLDSLTASADTIKYRYTRKYQRVEAVRNYLGLRYDFSTTTDYTYYSAHGEVQDSIPVIEFRYLTVLDYDSETSATYQWNEDSLTLVLNNGTREFNLRTVFQKVMENTSDNNHVYMFKKGELFCNSEDGDMRLIFRNLYFVKKDETKMTLQSFDAYLLIK